MKLTPLQSQKIIDATLSAWPLEMCGVCTDDDFIELRNVSDNPQRSFAFDPIEYGRLVESVTAIVHSHTKSIDEPEIYDLRTPSRKDRLNQRLSGKPWLIVGCEGEVVSEPVKLPRAPSDQYIGRPFMWFINDCYTLVQDYYLFERGISLMDHADEFDWGEGFIFDSLFYDYIEQAGFVEIDRQDGLKNGDLLILSRMGMSDNHLGIYHEGQVLHQEGLSVSVPASVFQNRISRVLRYVS